MVELVVVVAIALIIAGMAVPKFLTTQRSYRISGDARDISGELLLAKMRAGSDFSRSRVYSDISGKTFRVEVYNKTTSAWAVESGSQPLASGVSFGYGTLSTPPTGTQTTIGQPPACLDNAGAAIANTACVLFNSRGIPVDSTGTPNGNYALYITDGFSVFGSTISASGLIQTWQTAASSASWQRR